MTSLTFPDHLPEADRVRLGELVERNRAAHGDGLLGLALSGSAGRPGMATERSDLDVFVFLSPDASRGRTTSRSPEVDEIPWPLDDLDVPAAYGTEGWWYRWSCAWAPVLLDRTGGRIAAALRREATVTRDEADAIIVDHDRLGGWINFAYRALKADRDGRPLERRLDACESLPWLLDVVFSMAGRVRPYNKYLAWELEHHPVPGWEDLVDLVDRTLGGDPEALRDTFARIEVACRDQDASGGNRMTQDVVTDWGAQLEIFRS